MEYLSNLKNSKIDKFMISAFPSNQSKIFDYNRVIKDLNGYSEEKFIDQLSKNFDVNIVNKPFKPNNKKMFGMYHEKKWYSLDFKKKIDSKNKYYTILINLLAFIRLFSIASPKPINSLELL